MSVPLNIFDQIEHMTPFFDPIDLMEKRFINNSDNNPIYIGYAVIPNAGTNQKVWYVVKIEYDGEAVVRYRLPVDGPGFFYVWDDVVSYFS